MLNGWGPIWELDALHIALAVARAGWLAAVFSVTGALLFHALEPGLPPAAVAQLQRLTRASFIVSGAGWLAWVCLQSLALTGPEADKLLPVLWQTSFGRAAALQLALLVIAKLTARLPRPIPAALALAASALQVSHLHGWAMEAAPGLLTFAALLHVLAAAAWLGSLLPLRISVRYSPPAHAAAILRRYSRRAAWLVAVLAGTAVIQGNELLGGLPGIVGTAYGWIVLAKLLLFAALLGYAAQNRWRLLPLLARPEPLDGQRRLNRSIMQETYAGFAAVCAAALLSCLQPGMHAQPVWPFAVRPVLADGWRPHLVPAYPTSFYTSPAGFTAAAIAEGAELFPEQCGGCHATPGRSGASDGALFWWLAQGIPATATAKAMPGFAATLTDDERWQIIGYLRASDAGRRRAATGAWPPGLAAPGLDADCAGGRSVALHEMRDRPVRLVFAGGALPPADASVLTVLVPRPGATEASGGDCIASDPSVTAAYAIVTGQTAEQLAGSVVLIDAAGRLRGMLPRTP